MLTILLLIPFLGALLICVLPDADSSDNSESVGRSRTFTLVTLAVQCLLSFGLLIPFSSVEPGQ